MRCRRRRYAMPYATADTREAADYFAAATPMLFTCWLSYMPILPMPLYDDMITPMMPHAAAYDAAIIDSHAAASPPPLPCLRHMMITLLR